MKSWKTHLPFCVMLKQHAHHSVMSLLQGDCQRSKSILQAKQCGQTCPSQIFWRILQCFKPPTMSSNASLYALPLTTLSSDNLMNHESIKITDSLYIIVVIWTGNPEKKLHTGHLPNNFLFKFSVFFFPMWLDCHHFTSVARLWLAPLARRNRTTSAWPSCAAMYSGVKPAYKYNSLVFNLWPINILCPKKRVCINIKIENLL